MLNLSQLNLLLFNLSPRVAAQKNSYQNALCPDNTQPCNTTTEYFPKEQNYSKAVRWLSDLQSWESLRVNYHGSTTTFRLGGRGQPTNIAVGNNREITVAISFTHQNFSKHTYKNCCKHCDLKGLCITITALPHRTSMQKMKLWIDN